jgi:hypothetical protein
MTTLELIITALAAFGVAAIAITFAFWMGHMAGACSVQRVETGKPITRGKVSWLVVAADEDDDFAMLELSAAATEDDVRTTAAELYAINRTRTPKVRAFRAFELPISIEDYGEMEDGIIKEKVL